MAIENRTEATSPVAKNVVPVQDLIRILKWAEELNKGEDITADFIGVSPMINPPFVTATWLASQDEFIDWVVTEHIPADDVVRSGLCDVTLNTREVLKLYHEYWVEDRLSGLSPLAEIAQGYANEMLNGGAWAAVCVWVEHVRKALRDVPVDPMRVTLNVLGANKALMDWCPDVDRVVRGD